MGNVHWDEIVIPLVISLVLYGIPIVFAVWLFRAINRIQSKLNAIERQLNKQEP